MARKPNAPPQAAAPPEPPGLLPRAVRWALPALVLAVGVWAWWYAYDPKLDTGGDNAAYYLLGRALSQGHGYVNVWAPGAPPETKFPPGFPVLIAGVRLFSYRPEAVLVLNGLLFLGSLWLLYHFLAALCPPGADLSPPPAPRRGRPRREAPPGRSAHAGPMLAAIACIATALNPHVVQYATRLLSEMPFLFLSVLALGAAARIDPERPPYADPWVWATVAATAAAYYTRSMGVALAFGIFAGLALHRNGRAALVVGGGVGLLALPWVVRSQIVGENRYVGALLQKNPYAPEEGALALADLAERLRANTMRYLTTELPNGAWPFLERALPSWWWLRALAGLAVAGLALYGLYRLPRLRWVLAAYLGATFGIALLWPQIWTGTRFVMGVLPFVSFLSLLGLYHLAREGAERFGVRRAPAAAFALVLLPAAGPMQRWHAYAETPYPGRVANYFDLARWARRNLPRDAVVVCSKPSLFALYAYRRATQFALSSDPDVVIRRMEEEGADYVVLDYVLLDPTGYPMGATYLLPAVEKYPERFEFVHQITRKPDTYMLRFKPRGAAADTTAASPFAPPAASEAPPP